MAIVFPNKSISAAGNSINVPGSVIQFVDNTATINASATTAAWIDVLATTITTSKANNKILVEYLMNHRMDFGQGAWNLVYHRMLVSGAASGQVMYSGHMGSASLHIGYFERSFIYDAATAGTYTFTASCLAYQGTAWLGTNNSGSTNHYLRLYEIGT
jgi:hypothetical protein